MSSIIYLGKIPKATQVVSADLQERGISLLKAAPSDVKANVYPFDILPNYALYKHHLAPFIRAAETKEAQSLNNPYYLFTNKTTPSFFVNPLVVWNYNTPQSAERRDYIKSVYRAKDTLARGKPALMATLTVDSLRSLLLEDNPIQTTASNATSMNIAAYKIYLLLHRLYETVVSTHQYSGEPSEHWDGRLEIDEKDVIRTDHAAVGDEGKP